MVHDAEFEGADLDEAIRAASARLGTPESELHYEIVEQGRKGVFGIGAQNVRIRVQPPLDELGGAGKKEDAATGQADPSRPPRSKRRRRRRSRSNKDSSAERPPQKRPAAEPVSQELAEEVGQTLATMIELVGLELQVAANGEGGGVDLKLEGADQKLLVAKDAELLFAFQFVLNRMARRTWPDAGRIQISCEGELRQRDDDLVELVREVAQQVHRTGKTKKLHPMNAYERRLVHLTIREFTGLSSNSDGRGSLKRVRISRISNELETSG